MPRHGRQTTVFPVALREAHVARITDVTAGMRRVTLTGEQLGAFVSPSGVQLPGLRSDGFDDDIRLFFTAPGAAAPTLPTQGEGKLFWPKEGRPLYRAYTVRRWDADSGELDVDFVRHGIGLATTWADRARVGDRIHFFGPHASAGLPQWPDWLLIAGDETALPAIGRLLEELPGTARAQVFIELSAAGHRQELEAPPGVEITWVCPGGAVTGTSPLLSAVRAAPWWDGEVYAWLAGEQAVVRDLRRHLIEDRALARTAIDFSGYWKRSEVVALAGDAAVPDTETTSAAERFHDLVELVPPIAIRVAVGLGIGDLISRGVQTLPELARRTGSDERALGKLLRYLQSIDLLAQPEPGRYTLTELGEFLTDEWWVEQLDPAGPEGLASAGITGLAESIRTGEAAYVSVTGRPFADVRAEPAYADALLERSAEHATYLAPALAELPVLTTADRVVIRSPGAGVDARELTARHGGVTVTISAAPGQARWLRADLPVCVPDAAHRARIDIAEQGPLDPAPAADVVLLVHVLDGFDDTTAATALRAAAAGLSVEGRVLLVEDTFDTDELDEHDGEADLAALTRDGTGLRTGNELDEIVRAAGLRQHRTHTVGWGESVRELIPERPPDP